MKLADWLETRKMTQDAFGSKVGLTQGRISQIVAKGTRDIGTAMRIQRATDYEVTLADLLPPAVREAMAAAEPEARV